MATLLPYLQDERHIDLVFVLVAAHKNWTGDLDPAKYSDDELRGWLNEFNETEEAEWRTQLPNESRFGD